MQRARPYLDKLEAVLEASQSVAERYRLLRSFLGLAHLPTESTFRRHLREAGTMRKWIDRNIRLGSLHKVLKFAGQQDDQLLEDIQKAEHLTHEALEPPPGELVPPGSE
jgi:hypothetical protein